MIEVKQNSLDWHEWRKGGVGSSDVASVLNISPWKTRYQLWQEKTGQKQFNVSNAATQRGHDLEDKARAQFELLKGAEFSPAVVLSEEEEFLRASLDGWNKEKKAIVEIKCPGKETIELAKNNQIPVHYMAQMQYQLLLTSAEVCHYVVFDGKELTVIDVLPDVKFISEIYEEVVCFWDHVLSGTPPSLSEKDYKAVEDENTLKQLDRFKEIDRQIKNLKADQDVIRASVISSMTHPKMEGSGVKVYQTVRKGSVDWARAQKELNIDASRFRKKDVITYTFRISEDDSNGSDNEDMG